MKARKIDTVTVNELARAIEPEAWKESDVCAKKGITPLFETNLKCIQSLTAAQKVLNYLQD